MWSAGSRSQLGHSDVSGVHQQKSEVAVRQDTGFPQQGVCSPLSCLFLCFKTQDSQTPLLMVPVLQRNRPSRLMDASTANLSELQFRAYNTMNHFLGSFIDHVSTNKLTPQLIGCTKVRFIHSGFRLKAAFEQPFNFLNKLN